MLSSEVFFERFLRLRLPRRMIFVALKVWIIYKCSRMRKKPKVDYLRQLFTLMRADLHCFSPAPAVLQTATVL